MANSHSCWERLLLLHVLPVPASSSNLSQASRQPEYCSEFKDPTLLWLNPPSPKDPCLLLARNAPHCQPMPCTQRLSHCSLCSGTLFLWKQSCQLTACDARGGGAEQQEHSRTRKRLLHLGQYLHTALARRIWMNGSIFFFTDLNTEGPSMIQFSHQEDVGLMKHCLAVCSIKECRRHCFACTWLN